jgi:hypothetical protein
MPARKLTGKQEAFCQSIAAGHSQIDSYKSAYDAKKMKDSAIYVHASRLVSNAKITLRIAELKKSIEKKYLWTKEMSVRALMQAYKEGAPSVKVSAVKELNVMHGYNAPAQVELSLLNPMVIIRNGS